MKSTVKSLSVVFLIGLVLLWSFIAGTERLVFYNTDQYPEFLVNNTFSLDSKEKLYKLIELTCPKEGGDIVERKGATYIRCGFLWPASKVMKIYLVNKSSVK